MKKQVLIGYNWQSGRSEQQWLFWLKNKLLAQGFNATLLEVKEWPKHTTALVETLKQQYGIDDAHVHIVGKDPGCLTMLSYLERLAKTPSIDSALLVAGNVAGPQSQRTSDDLSSPPAYYYLPQSSSLDRFRNQSETPNLNASVVILYSALNELPSSQFLKMLL